MKYLIVPVTPFVQNCTLLWCEETKEAVVIDPGGDCSSIMAALKDEGLTAKYVLLTHGHIDHAGGAAALARQLGVDILGPHEADRYWLEDMGKQAQMFGLGGAESCVPTRWLDEGEEIAFGREVLQVLHCPGHTPGHIIFYNAKAGLAQVGDVLFQGSVGRTDFPGGSYETLMNSIHNKLLPLGDEVRFIPGHGPMSRLGEERRSNPFLR